MLKVGFFISGRGRLAQSAINQSELLGINPVCIFLDEKAWQYKEIWLKYSGLKIYEGDWSNKSNFYEKMNLAITETSPDLVMVTFDKLIPPQIINTFQGEFINVHTSLLPSFKGFGAIKSIIKNRVCVAGATLHFITSGIDDGPIIAQCVVSVQPEDTEETLGKKIYEKLQPMYVQCIKWFKQKRILTSGAQVGRVINARYTLEDGYSPALEDDI